MAEALKFYINLARDEVRGRAMQAAFASCRHRPQRFDAVDWRALSAQEQGRYYRADVNEALYFRGLTAGECGCYVSHLEVWRLLLNSDAPWALVLEDDVEPEPHFDAVLDSIDRLPPAWDLIKLMGRQQEKLARQQALTPDSRLVQYSRIPILASGYAVSRAGAQKLLASRIPFARPIDVDLRWWWENDLRVFGVMPYGLRLAQTSDVSSIGERRGRRDLRTRLHKSRLTLQYNVQLLATARRQARFWDSMLTPGRTST
jgi:glycosyl transferase, family 25